MRPRLPICATAGIPAEAVRAYLEELGLPRSDVQLDPARIERLSVEAIQAMGDEELAERAGAPVRVVPAMRGARTLVEAREAAGVVLEPPEPVPLPGAELTLTRFVELRSGADDDLDEIGARSIIRELKAVGGDLRALRRALTGRDRGPELWAVLVALPGEEAIDRVRRVLARNRATDPGVASDSMRLYSSLSRRLEELPPPPGPVGMYFCGPTVYQRIHVGNARPFVISMWLKRWLEGQGYDVDLVENITDINDKIYDAAAGLACGAPTSPRRRRTGTSRTRMLLGLGRPDYEPKASETVSRIVALIDELIERGLAYEVKGDVYFRVGRVRRVREALRPAARPGRGAGAESAEGRPARLRALEGDEAGRGHVLGLARGVADAPAGTSSARRWRRSYSGRSFEIHGGGLDLVFPHHENELAQSRGAGREFARIWMHNGMLRSLARRCPSRSGTSSRCARRCERWGRCCSPSVLHDCALAEARSTSPRRLSRRQTRRFEAFGTGFSGTSGKPRRHESGTTSSKFSTTTSIRRMRLRSSTNGRQRDRPSSCGEGLMPLG